MKKTIYTIALVTVALLSGAKASAQQTLQEATDSIKNILDQAKQGDAKCQNEVGTWYYIGRHVNQNYREALQWWARAAKQGDATAIGNMGICYQNGNGVTADSLKAAKLYIKSIAKGNKQLLIQNIERASKGSVFSNMLVAACYQDGIGVNKDAEQAVPYLTFAANKNSVTAQRDLGVLMLNLKKPNEAATWFKKASVQGDIPSTYWYGKMLLDGTGVKQDKKEGANYLLKAAEAGMPKAMEVVGDCYATGDGLTKNAEQAFHWYRLAAGAGANGARWTLAQCYRKGLGTAVNYDQALYWYAESYATGHARAFKTLLTDDLPNTPFLAYMKGMKAYNDKDYDAALKQFKIVEKAKVDDGKVMTAAIMANSSYDKTNAKKGVKLLKKVAITSPQAMYLLGALYEAGKGVDKDMNQAVEYMTKAADLGYAPAECALADMYFEGRGVEKNYEEAVKWYAKADAQGQLTDNAAKRYASCYENGWGVPEADPAQAEEILKSDRHGSVAKLLSLV